MEHAGVAGGDMQFTVTRHTPRHRPPRRIFTPPEDPLPSTGKRLKLDPQTTATPGKYRNCHSFSGLPYQILKVVKAWGQTAIQKMVTQVAQVGVAQGCDW